MKWYLFIPFMGVLLWIEEKDMSWQADATIAIYQFTIAMIAVIIAMYSLFILTHSP